MSDEMNVNDQLLPMYNLALENIAKIDSSLGDADVTGRRAFRNSLLVKHAELVDPNVASIKAKLDELDAEILTAVVTAISRALSSYDKKIDAYLDEAAPKPEASTEKIDEAAKNHLLTQRKAFLTKAITFREFAETLGADVSAWADLPPKRNVSSGPRGKQALSTYTYLLEDAEGTEIEMDEDEATLLGIAKKYGFDKSSQLKAAFRDEKSGATYLVEDEEGNVIEKVGIDTTTPPAIFYFTFENGHKLTATKGE